MDVKTAFLNGNLRRGCVHDTAYGFWRSKGCWESVQASWIHLWIEACITELESLIWQGSQNLDFVRCEEESYMYRKTSGSAITFLNLICRWHTLNRKRYSSILQLAKSSLKKVFLMKDLGEAVYILDIKIYRDRLIWLIGLSQSTNIDQVLKSVQHAGF